MPVLDAVFVGRIYLPEISTGPVPPQPSVPPPLFPSNPIPIYPGGSPNPPGIWGPGGPGFPSNPIAGIPGLPGYQPPVGVMPPLFPSNPIPIYPGGSPNPPGFWGPLPGFPTPPIVLPTPPTGGGGTPSHPINSPPGDNPNWLLVYVPGLGWVWALVPGAAGKPPETPPGGGEQSHPEPSRSPL